MLRSWSLSHARIRTYRLFQAALVMLAVAFVAFAVQLRGRSGQPDARAGCNARAELRESLGLTSRTICSLRS